MTYKEALDLTNNYFPTENYALVLLDEEVIETKNELIIPNTVHYETDGGKMAAHVQPKLFENRGHLLRATNSKLEDFIQAQLDKKPYINPEIKVILRDKSVIENFKDTSIKYDNIVIINISDIRLIHIYEKED